MEAKEPARLKPFTIRPSRRLHGLEHHAAKVARMAFFRQHDGEPAEAIAVLAKQAGHYSPTTYLGDIATSIMRRRDRGELPPGPRA